MSTRTVFQSGKIPLNSETWGNIGEVSAACLFAAHHANVSVCDSSRLTRVALEYHEIGSIILQ